MLQCVAKGRNCLLRIRMRRPRRDSRGRDRGMPCRLTQFPPISHPSVYEPVVLRLAGVLHSNFNLLIACVCIFRLSLLVSISSAPSPPSPTPPASHLEGNLFLLFSLAEIIIAQDWREKRPECVVLVGKRPLPYPHLPSVLLFCTSELPLAPL